MPESTVSAAFDKNDALFMRDEAEKARHRELEQRDAELAQFSKMRAKIDQEAALEMMDAGPMPKRTKIAKCAFPCLRPTLCCLKMLVSCSVALLNALLLWACSLSFVRNMDL